MGLSSRCRRHFVFCASLSLLGFQILAHGQDYIVVDLGVLPGAAWSQASDINNVGTVVGTSGGRPFLWDSVNGMVQLSTLGNGDGSADAINESGDVAGSSSVVSELCCPVHAALWSNGNVITLGVLGDNFSFGSGINEQKHVVGQSSVSFDPFATRSFLWNGSFMSDLGSLGGRDSFATDINNFGQVVGYAEPSRSEGHETLHAFLWKIGSGMRDLGHLGGDLSIANAINDLGQVVGISDTFSGAGHAFLWEDGENGGTMSNLGIPVGFSSSEARDINNQGEIVGKMRRTSQFAFRAFLFNNVLGYFDLNALIDPNSGWVLESAEAINDAGQIVGRGFHNGQLRGFLLTPNISLGINCSNSGEMRPGTPDVDFLIDEDDEEVEDTLGFEFWWSRENSQQLTEMGIVDLAPLTITVPQILLDSGATFYLKVEGDVELDSMWLYPAVSKEDNRRAYLQSAEVATKQLQKSDAGIQLINGAEPIQIELSEGGTHEFVFKALGSGIANATLTLFMQEPTPSANLVVRDTIELTFRDTINYWLFASSRGTEANPTHPTIEFTYPTEDDRTVTINRYPSPTETSLGGATAGTIDPEKQNYVVFVHGYANSLEQAFNANTEYYKRLYWLGYRGNYIGFAWEGDEQLVLFDPNVKNSFQTSPALMYFLRNLRELAGDPVNVNVIAHSLGNLVAWDAMRLHEVLYPAEKLFRNICSVESAVWSELWDPPEELNYTHEDSDPITYSVDHLKRHSWQSWFNQIGNDPQDVLVGKSFHSYLKSDQALIKWMRRNDYLLRGWFLGRRLHYYRDSLLCDRINPCYREPDENFWHLAELPTILAGNRRKLNYNRNDLNYPAGAIENPFATGENYSSTSGGWRENHHSDFRDLSYSKIYEWWNQFLGNRDQKQDARIPMGEE